MPQSLTQKIWWLVVDFVGGHFAFPCSLNIVCLTLNFFRPWNFPMSMHNEQVKKC